MSATIFQYSCNKALVIQSLNNTDFKAKMKKYQIKPLQKKDLRQNELFNNELNINQLTEITKTTACCSFMFRGKAAQLVSNGFL